MIIKRSATITNIVNNEPLSYEYNSVRKSVILLKGYEYVIFINGEFKYINLKNTGVSND